MGSAVLWLLAFHGRGKQPKTCPYIALGQELCSAVFWLLAFHGESSPKIVRTSHWDRNCAVPCYGCSLSTGKAAPKLSVHSIGTGTVQCRITAARFPGKSSLNFPCIALRQESYVMFTEQPTGKTNTSFGDCFGIDQSL